MTGLVFVDTNILLYSIDSRDPRKQVVAKEWLDRLWRTQTGRTGMQVLNEFYFNATTRLKPGLDPAEAWEWVTALMAWQPQPVDVELLDIGRRVQVGHRLNWWDCLIVAAANRQGCSTRLSEDLGDGESLAGVTGRNPFAERVQEPIAGYAAIIARPQPRGRGRPRRNPGVTGA
jgi:predicted nucleic acid-binding protein